MMCFFHVNSSGLDLIEECTPAPAAAEAFPLNQALVGHRISSLKGTGSSFVHSEPAVSFTVDGVCMELAG